MAFGWPDLSARSHERELIDDEASLASSEIVLMHRELRRINRLLGGVSASLSALLPHLPGNGPITLVDIGAGGADLPRALIGWARSRRREVRAYVLDLSPRSSAHARARGEEGIVPIVGDGRRLPLRNDAVDFAHAALLLHHLSDADGARVLGEMRRVARRGVVVNDLHRHAFAWSAIRVLTRLFSRSRLIRNDAPLSVRRGFTREELTALFRTAGARGSVRWRWAFRWVSWTDA